MLLAFVLFQIRRELYRTDAHCTRMWYRTNQKDFAVLAIPLATHARLILSPTLAFCSKTPNGVSLVERRTSTAVRLSQTERKVSTYFVLVLKMHDEYSTLEYTAGKKCMEEVCSNIKAVGVC